MSIEEMIMNGASPEEINAAMQEIYLEKEREEQDRIAKEAIKETLLKKLAEEEARKELLKREARAYIINGMLAYCEAFDLLDGEDPDESDIEEIETYLLQMEAYLPIAKEIAKLKAEQEDKFGDGFNFGLFGGPFGGMR